MQGAGGHVESGGDDERLNAHIAVFPYEKRESDIEADADAEPAPRGAEHRRAAAGRERVALAKALPAADVHFEVAEESDGCRVTVTNDSDVVAYQNVLPLTADAGKLIGPAFWSDNFFSLLPHETKVVTCRTENGAKGTVGLTGWNR